LGVQSGKRGTQEFDGRKEGTTAKGPAAFAPPSTRRKKGAAMKKPGDAGERGFTQGNPRTKKPERKRETREEAERRSCRRGGKESSFLGQGKRIAITGKQEQEKNLLLMVQSGGEEQSSTRCCG